MKKIIFLMLFALVGWQHLHAQTFSFGGLIYNVSSSTTVKVGNQNGAIIGNVTIPSQVTNANVTYAVTSIDASAFSACSRLTGVTIPNSVTSIGDRAFENCTGLTSFTIPSSIGTVGAFAFVGCSGLTSVSIPNSITSIGSNVFRLCSRLTGISIPNSVTSIGTGAFAFCSSLTSITIPNSVTSIGTFAFNGCSGLTSVSIPNSITSITGSVFLSCSSLTSVSIPNSVTSIGSSAFNGCSRLTSVTIPNSVTSIGDAAFSGCRGLTNVQSDTATPISIATSVFSLVNQATCRLVVPAGSVAVYQTANVWKNFSPICTPTDNTTTVSACGSYTWANNGQTYTASGVYTGLTVNCITEKLDLTITAPPTSFIIDHLLYVVISPTTVTVGSNPGTIGDIVIPATVVNACGSYQVTSISVGAFVGCSGLTSVSIPNSVASIGNSAFSGCTGLTSVLCNSTQPIDIAANVFNIVNQGACRLVVPDGSQAAYLAADVWKNFSPILCANQTYNTTKVSACGSYTWANNGQTYTASGVYTGLTVNCITEKLDLTITAPLTSFDSGGLYYQVISLTTVMVSSNPGTSGDIVIPATVVNACGGSYQVTRIDGVAFSGCSGMTSVSIPNSVTKIGDGAFKGCSSLSSVTIPNSVTYIGTFAFENCVALTSITIPSALTSIRESTFENCIGLTSVTIPNSVTSIGERAFANCIGFTSFSIPNSVTTIGNYAFVGCSGLTAVSIPNSVTTIGNRAFENCKNLTAVTLSQSLTSINEGLFNGCSQLISITIPNSVTSIDDNAFNNCQSLTSITIPNSVTSIGNSAFANCTDLTSLTIPNSVTSIGSSAFESCKNLTEVTISQSLTSINERLFNGCQSLTSVTIPNSVTSIGDEAFRGCSSLTSVTIPNSVTSIGNYAFMNCTGLISLTIPNSVTSIGSGAFEYCTGLTSLTISNSVTSIGSSAFESCKNLTEVTISQSLTRINERLFNGCQSLTSVTIPNSVTSIGERVFENCTGLTSFTIPSSITTIGAYAFAGCSGLTSVSIPNSITSIGSNVFRLCSSLISVTCNAPSPITISSNVFEGVSQGACSLTVPAGSVRAYQAAAIWQNFALVLCSGAIDNKTTISACGGYTWANNGQTYTASGVYTGLTANCVTEILDLTITAPPASFTSEGLTYQVTSPTTVAVGSNLGATGDIVIPATVSTACGSYQVTSINVEAFFACSSLTSVSIPNSVTSIGNRAFESCKNLTEVTLSQSLTRINERLFNGCPSLTSVTIPNSVTSIGDEAFRGCSSLTSVTIPNSVTSIGVQTFYGCSGLTSIIIPNSVTSIGVEAFSVCKSLTSVSIPNSVTSIGNFTFLGCYRLTSVTIQNSVTTIGNYAFANCIGLTSLTIPNSVTSIGISAFEYCTGLTSLTIPDSVTSIASSAFANCTGLTSITIPNSVTSIGSSAFESCKNLTAVTLSQSLTRINERLFNGCQSLTSVTIPNSVTSIGDEAFKDCNNLTSITIPDSVTNIGNYTFFGCSILTSVTIPNSVTNIGQGAFYFCYSLKLVICNAITPVAIAANVFGFVNLGAISLVVPAESVAAYQVAAVWKDFYSIGCTLTTFKQVSPRLCGDPLLTELPTTSIEGIVGTWSPALNNFETTTYTFTPNAGHCATKASMTIDVHYTPPPTAASNQLYSGRSYLANLAVTGTAIRWYDAPSGGSALSHATALVDGTTYYASQKLVCESDRTPVTVKSDDIPPTMSFCAGTRVAAAVGISTQKFYSAVKGGLALSGSTLLVTKTYYVTNIVNGLESSPRVPVAVTINALPGTIATITPSDTVLCKYIGTTNTLTYTATPGASSYIWTVPTGVTIIDGQGTNILKVDFHTATISGVGVIGNITVKAVNASGCASATAKTIILSTKLPTTPSKIALTINGVATTSVGVFVGDATKALVLEATDVSNTANIYTWELPAGVSVVRGNATTDKIISIHLGGVAPGISNLVFKAYAVAGCGISESRSLVVTRTLPATPRALALTDDAISTVNPISIVSGYTGKFKTTPLTLTATPSTGNGTNATSYKWILPSGIGIVNASAAFVSENSGFKTYTSTSNAIKINLSGVGSATSLLLQVYGVNGNGESLLPRNLTLRSAIPTRPGTLTTASGSAATYHPTCGTITIKVPNVFGVEYTWSIKDGAVASVLSTNSDGNEATIAISKLPSALNSSFKIGVVASNGTGSSETIYTIKLGTACSNILKTIDDDKTTKVANEFKVIAYPNPSSNVFNVKIESLENTKTELSVYDSIGRLIEQLQAQTNEVELGSRYPAGVYNLIVKQGTNVKTVRVAKQ